MNNQQITFNTYFGNNTKHDTNIKKLTIEKIYLYVPFNDKDEAKKDGALWDNNVKKWYINSDHPNCKDIKNHWHMDCFKCNFYGEYRSHKSVKDIKKPSNIR